MSTSHKQVEYVLFDMDGLMIDSEKIYTDVTSTSRISLSEVPKPQNRPTYLKSIQPDQILAQYGKEMTWDMKAGCMGKPELQASEHLLSFFPDISLTLESYLSQRNTLQDTLWPTVPLLPGVRKLILHLKAHNIPIAVATGSRRRNFELKTGHLDEIFGCFEGKVICGDDEKWGMRGKPEPDIFVVAAREMLGRDVGEAKATDKDLSERQKEERGKGLVLEDGLPGMQAGKRAGMSVIWVPDANLLDVEYSGEEKADQVLRSLEDFVPEQWGLPPY